jgi:hypothetical protein
MGARRARAAPGPEDDAAALHGQQTQVGAEVEGNLAVVAYIEDGQIGILARLQRADAVC